MARSNNGTGIILGIHALFLAASLALHSPLMTDPEGATETLEDAGLVDIEITGGRWFGGKDVYRTCFKATNVNGKDVKGYVSEGMFFKGSTIRYER